MDENYVLLAYKVYILLLYFSKHFIFVIKN